MVRAVVRIMARVTPWRSCRSTYKWKSTGIRGGTVHISGVGVKSNGVGRKVKRGKTRVRGKDTTYIVPTRVKRIIEASGGSGNVRRSSRLIELKKKISSAAGEMSAEDEALVGIPYGKIVPDSLPAEYNGEGANEPDGDEPIAPAWSSGDLTPLSGLTPPASQDMNMNDDDDGTLIVDPQELHAAMRAAIQPDLMADEISG